MILVVRGVTLPGAADGLKFLFSPDWKAFGSPQVYLIQNCIVTLNTPAVYYMFVQNVM